MDDLTEEKAAYLFARAWNRLNPEGFLALLGPEARYASQWVFEELVGAPAIAAYLRAKMATVRDRARDDPGAAVRVEMGRTAEGRRGRPCAFMTQGQFEEVQAAVVFEIEGGRIVRYDLCIPQLLGAVRTGVYPL
jgi:fructose 1,6-bisphosphatase